jgi:hypothetical protein
MHAGPRATIPTLDDVSDPLREYKSTSGMLVTLHHHCLDETVLVPPLQLVGCDCPVIFLPACQSLQLVMCACAVTFLPACLPACAPNASLSSPHIPAPLLNLRHPGTLGTDNGAAERK